MTSRKHILTQDRFAEEAKKYRTFIISTEDQPTDTYPIWCVHKFDRIHIESTYPEYITFCGRNTDTIMRFCKPSTIVSYLCGNNTMYVLIYQNKQNNDVSGAKAFYILAVR